MSFGKQTTWRLLSPLVALIWVLAAVAFSGAARASDTAGGTDATSTSGQSDSNGPDAHASVHASAQASDHASAEASDHASAGASASSGSGPADLPPGQAKKSSSEHGGTSGDTSQPQPISNADANSGGANGQCPGGPYCSTRDGSPSMNGNGGGKATGKPCAGCVGKADNKNPKGQMPNGSDHNAGYECDTNHGVGRTNPAHTGCQSAPPECVPTPTVPCVPTPPECVPTPTVPCVPTPPECVPTPTAPCVPTTPPVVSPPVVSPVVSPPAAAPPPSQVVSAPTVGLPNTGAPADLLWLAGAALASILAGAGLLVGRRKLTA